MPRVLDHPTKLLLLDDDPGTVRWSTKIVHRECDGQIEIVSLTDQRLSRRRRPTKARRQSRRP